MAPATRSVTSRQQHVAEMDAGYQEEAETKAQNVFYEFRSLPPELRFYIWELALQTESRPGIQYFSIHNRTSRRTRKSPLQFPPVTRHSSAMTRRSVRRVRFRAAAPRVPGRARDRTRPEYSWFKVNRSAYTVNGGLLNACQESRRITIQYLERKMRNCSTRRNEITGLSTSTPGTMSTISAWEKGFNFLLRVNAHSDIFCLEFEHKDIASFLYLDWDLLLRQISIHSTMGKPQNIAFEFNYSWLSGPPFNSDDIVSIMDEPSPRGIVVQANTAWLRGSLPKSFRVWLIDRSQPVDRKTFKDARLFHERFFDKDEFASLRGSLPPDKMSKVRFQGPQDFCNRLLRLNDALIFKAPYYLRQLGCGRARVLAYWFLS